MGSITPSHPTPEKPSILFITANLPTPEDEAAIWIGKIEAYLHDPLAALRARGATVTLRTFQDASLTAAAIASSYTHILLLAVDRYIHHMPAFTALLTTTLPAAQRLNPRLLIHNPPGLAAWNANKTYLAELQAVATGFAVPRTAFLDPATTTAAALAIHLAADPRVAAAPTTPIVLKPSIAASGHSTYLIRTPLALSPADGAALDAMRGAAAATGRNDAMLLVQEYLPRVAEADGADGDGGEWSFVVVAGRLTHAVRKRPREGEFRINSAFKGVWEPMEAGDKRVPACGKVVAGRVWEWLVAKEGELRGEGREGRGEGELLYARVDGVVGADGEFVLMEVELIEPWLWLLDREGHPGREGLRVFVDAVLGAEE
ncbi:hypothetical protein SLS55_000088 [Diplodia seriata]|uniref:ATP-grasp domain-containing protein n=1 Tax=Diplodia seriata TaxID=420778 RepID=A0ABR3CTA1_9PEZI